MPNLSSILGFAVLLVVSSQTANAATLASDNQADPAYTTWDPGDNGGIGWGSAWTFRDQTNLVLTATDANHGWFVSNSTHNNSTGGDSNGDRDINSPSTRKACGLYSNASGKDIYAVRAFDGALAAGQTFKFDMDNG